MRTTLVLNGPPVFRFWKDFGAPKRRKIPFYKQWWDIWRGEIVRRKVKDYTLAASQLPAGSRLMEAEDFLKGHISDLPDRLIRDREEKIVYDHPWPFDYKPHPLSTQDLQYCYKIGTRFFVPRQDSFVLTNTLLETDEMKADSPVQVTEEHVDYLKRQYEWATKEDSVLVRLPKFKKFPKINITPSAQYGISKERQEVNVLNSLFDYSQILLAKHYHEHKDTDKLDELLLRRSIAFPNCNVPFKRDGQQVNLELCIDSMNLAHSPIPPIESQPNTTKQRQLVDIKPRGWKSVLEQSRKYNSDWSFKLPTNSFLHTIQLASRIKRDHRNTDEMLARSLVHAFGVTSQFARFRYNNVDKLEEPVVVKVIGFELPSGNFHFTKFQLNTINFDDETKNQAWYSGPISDLGEALKYYLDFQSRD